MSIDFHDYFTYDETSQSCLRWKIEMYCGNPKRLLRYVGEEAGGVTEGGGKSKPWKYYGVRVNRQGYRAHRVIYEMFFGAIPEGLHVDHIDGDTFNNKISNLRLVDPKKSSHNLKMFSTNTSGITGVMLKNRSNGEISILASWVEADGQRSSKSFSVKKYGLEKAWELGIAARSSAIARMNEQGADYTQRHGFVSTKDQGQDESENYDVYGAILRVPPPREIQVRH